MTGKHLPKNIILGDKKVKALKITLKVILIVVISLIVLAGLAFLGVHLYRKHYSYKVPASIERSGANTVIAQGKALYDEDGKLFEIKGINFGNLFISEGWMTVNSIGASYNEDGSFKKVTDQGIVEEYEELFQDEMDAILAERFTDEQIENLNNAYFSSYCTSQDFINIKGMGFNTIRLPIYYRSFLTTHDRYRMTDEQLCAMNFEDITLNFEKLDSVLAMAKEQGLRVIVDMHGVMGGQNGFEHSGTRDIDFWDNQDYIYFMCKLWHSIAEHYQNDRADLASTILAYDLVNEPTNRNEVGTGSKQWGVMDKLYKAIREVDTEHVISIEGCWNFMCLPNPAKYGWENVLYQYHFYNWNPDKIPNWLYYDYLYATLLFADYDVPKFVGEFNFFNNESDWLEYLDVYDQTGLGWTIWSYKIVSVGWWDSSWGMSVYKMNLQNSADTPIQDYNLKLDLRTASYEEILASWSNQYTDDGTNNGSYKFNDDSALAKFLQKYFEQLAK